MGCSTCPGALSGARILETVRHNRVMAVTESTVYIPAPTGQEMIFILYTGKNTGMHIVKSPMRPRLESGNIINDYGRRRGATTAEKQTVKDLGGVMTVEEAVENKMINQCVFFVHPVDIAARPDLFQIIDPNMGTVEPMVEAEPAQLDSFSIEEEVDDSRDFVNFDVSGMTKAISADLVAQGWVTIDELALAEPYEIEDSMTETKTITKLERATMIIESAKELA